ncbi:hypothetical protein EW146_g2344 [Bondarzewia mesenterica]|uniref:Uncharacterized protein n=1 Tax=Bondarzewia mesenterica TaxID=1095465 RepID=A0A4S4M749_9AGAM|nr:hypothetical protein EW146_g2344 [Bondarzewia mesenterica]
MYNGRVLVSTFAGETAAFGGKGWEWARERMEEIAPIHFVPAFFVDPARYPSLKSIDGIFHWNGSWPLHLNPSSHRSEIACPRLDSDRHHLHHLKSKNTHSGKKKKTYMAAVSPWFFTVTLRTRFVEQELDLSRRRLALRPAVGIYSIDPGSGRDGPDNIMEWCAASRLTVILLLRPSPPYHSTDSTYQLHALDADYGESHYIGPIKGAQPNSEGWVNGFPHLPWLKLNSHFARAFREGPPAKKHWLGLGKKVEAKMEKDEIYVWARPHLKDAPAPDAVERPSGWELTDDKFWAVIFATSPASITLCSKTEKPQYIQIPAGISKLSHPLVPGGGIQVQMIRNGVVVAQCAPTTDEFCVHERPEVYNFNAFVAMSE